MLFDRSLGKHLEQGTRNCRRRGDRRGGQKLRDPAGALYIGQAENPAGDAGTDIGTHDNADRLEERDHTGVDEADYHHGRSGRRLNDRRHDRAEEHPF